MNLRASFKSTLLASLILLAACTDAPAYKEAFVLVEDNRLRCEDVASDVLAYWDSRIYTPEESINNYYSGDGRLKIAPMEVRLAQSRELLSRISSRSGEVRDLLLEFYAAVENLCGIARSPAGYSRMTFNDRRSDIRDEIEGAKAKLEVLLPTSGGERADILKKFASAIQEAESRAQKAIAADKERLQAQKRRESERAEVENAERRLVDLRTEEAEREIRRRAEAEEAERSLLERQVEEENRHQAELAKQAREKERRKYLHSTNSDARTWFEQSYPTFDHFCEVANKFTSDLQTSRFERFRECSALKESIAILRDRAAKQPVPQEISVLVTKILDSYEGGAAACLQRSVLISVSSFTRGHKVCGQLRTHVSEYGFTSE